jgi:hypothetical protein
LKPRNRAARYGLDGRAGGPRAYYSDPVLARARRRRPTALERYLAPEGASAEEEAEPTP